MPANNTSSIHKKLRISAGMKLLTVGAPSTFKSVIDDPSLALSIGSFIKNYDQVHWFVESKADVDKNADKVLGLLKEKVICWIYFPKGSSGMQTDLTRDKGWEKLQAQKNLQWLSLVSFDDTWSTFAMRLEDESAAKKKSLPKAKPVSDHVDPVKKTVRVPDDLKILFEKEKAAAAFFDTLSFTNRKEYVEWIVSAKKQETRIARLSATISRLNDKWKNPANT